ncbi:hypothetical protein EIO00_19695 [Thermomonospora catenispora]|nr:hypothetical protein EIO00_19695 [Thermomonospora catenispora]
MTDWRLPGYVELGELGRGAQGRVVLARGETDGGLVAIKYLDPRGLADERALERFRNEARALAQVRDRHVVRLHGLVETAEGAALVMEAVHGASLRTLLDRYEPMSPESALAGARGVAAHPAGPVRAHVPGVGAGGAQGLAAGTGRRARRGGDPPRLQARQRDRAARRAQQAHRLRRGGADRGTVRRRHPRLHGPRAVEGAAGLPGRRRVRGHLRVLRMRDRCAAVSGHGPGRAAASAPGGPGAGRGRPRAAAPAAGARPGQGAGRPSAGRGGVRGGAGAGGVRRVRAGLGGPRLGRARRGHGGGAPARRGGAGDRGSGRGGDGRRDRNRRRGGSRRRGGGTGDRGDHRRQGRHHGDHRHRGRHSGGGRLLGDRRRGAARPDRLARPAPRAGLAHHAGAGADDHAAGQARAAHPRRPLRPGLRPGRPGGPGAGQRRAARPAGGGGHRVPPVPGRRAPAGLCAAVRRAGRRAEGPAGRPPAGVGALPVHHPDLFRGRRGPAGCRRRHRRSVHRAGADRRRPVPRRRVARPALRPVAAARRRPPGVRIQSAAAARPVPPPAVRRRPHRRAADPVRAHLDGTGAAVPAQPALSARSGADRTL